MTIGPGNVHRPMFGPGGSKTWFPELSSEREPLAEVSASGKEIKVTVEMPGIEKKDIKVNASDDQVEITAEGATTNKKYRKVVDLPSDVTIWDSRNNF
jgi:HSP20 family molecular chaperone IbpA